MDIRNEPEFSDTVAAIKHLTGGSRGSIAWLRDAKLNVALDIGRLELLDDIAASARSSRAVARLRRSGASYEIEALAGQPLWVNGAHRDKATLSHGDVIEFGETGPLSRFRLYDADHRMQTSVDEILSDCVAYLRISRKPLGSRVARAGADVSRRLVRDTTTVFRVGVVVAIIVLATLAYQQYRLNTRLERSIEYGAAQIDSIAAALARARADAPRPSDLAALRDELGQRVTSNLQRLETLERRSGATARVIADTVDAVAFLQGAYGLREKATGRMLRQIMAAEGLPMISPRGQPLLSFDADGPVAEVQFTGTGFFLAGGDLVTTRHVALPWESGEVEATLTAQGNEAVMLKFVAYLPGRSEAIPVAFSSASDEADLAILRPLHAPPDLAGLRLSETPPEAGQEAILMGYPAGLRAMLAQSGATFINALLQAGDFSFWEIGARLAQERHITPLASRGIVGKVGSAAIVYDAETTHGGSGGPVLNLDGKVIAVNSAILPEFGGSNLGVPAVKLREMQDNAPVR